MPTRAYGQYCPVARTAEIIADRWTPLIVRELLAGVDGFNALYRSLPGISRSVLTDRLRCLANDGVVVMRRGEAGQRTTYRLTPAGQDLSRVLAAMADWGFRWAFGDPRPEEQDPWLLLWWMRRGALPVALPERRVVVQFDFTGPWMGTYWLLLESCEVTICLHHPGYDIDMLVTTDASTLYRVWLGRLSLAQAQRAGRVQIDGPPDLVRGFTTSWFNWDAYASSPPPRSTGIADMAVPDHH